MLPSILQPRYFSGAGELTVLYAISLRVLTGNEIRHREICQSQSSPETTSAGEMLAKANSGHRAESGGGGARGSSLAQFKKASRSFPQGNPTPDGSPTFPCLPPNFLGVHTDWTRRPV